MAVFREPPKCPFCKKILAKAVYKDYSGVPVMQMPLGDSFVRWDYEEKHECEEAKEYWRKYYETPAGKKAIKAMKKWSKDFDKNEEK